MWSWISRQWQERPLSLILLTAILVRVIAVIFSRGYGMLDDHFLVIEAGQSWVDGNDYNNWLPSSGNTEPKGHSFFYPGIHSGIFWILEQAGLTDPQGKMYIVRFLHALLSLVTVVIGYRITYCISDKKTARMAALLLAIYWFMPFLSVRNMVEVVSIPLLMLGTWIILKNSEPGERRWSYLWAGIILGLAFDIRFQTILFSGGLGLVMLIRRQWIPVLVLSAGYIIAVFLVQGVIDMFIWGYPFAELTEYINHNIIHSTDYIVSPWYTYLLLITGILIPPVSIYLLAGFFISWKKNILIFLPAFIFLVFHSIFPNKQERFILPIIPFIIMAGLAGWNKFVNLSSFWQKNKGLLKASWIFFWIINLALLPVISTTYSKKALCESMYYLYGQNAGTVILADASHRHGVPMLPRYYSGAWPAVIETYISHPPSSIDSAFITDPEKKPRFLIFIEEKDIESRIEAMRKIYPHIEYETTIEPGFIDRVMHGLNPVNANNVIVIYRNGEFP
ncbi:MAG: glycosyltransferase family 39 protein [Bacteroidetes bacterium]|nr:glycosyltransferase family 39 protein [Bacteroidota bacterium]